MNPNILRAMIIAQMRAILGFVFRYIIVIVAVTIVLATLCNVSGGGIGTR